MIQDMIMHEILLKEHGKIPLNYKYCYNHTHRVIFPIEYDECPACCPERITRITLGKD